MSNFLPTWSRAWPLVLVPAVMLSACGGREPSRPAPLTIAYSNDLHGEIRSCGCAAHDLGGLGRRATFLAALADTAEGDVLRVEAGDFFGAGINYGTEKAEVTMKSMALMGYHGVVPGEDEFGFGIDYIVRRAREVGLPLLAANLYDAAGDSLLFAPSRIVTLESGRRVALVGVLGSTLKLPPQADGKLAIRDPLPAAQAQVDSLRSQADLVVVLAHMPRGEAQRFATDLAGVDVVLHGHDGRPMRQTRKFGGTYMLQLTARGLYMGVARATFAPAGSIATINDGTVGMDQR
jgi:2',3'-cyclic-nucleotide 2'-phosphodiesterase (5'-nucleotidase family)